MINSPEQIPYRSVYLAVGLLVAGGCWGVDLCCVTLTMARTACGGRIPQHDTPPPLLPPGRHGCLPLTATLPPMSCRSTGLAMFISGLVLWQTEGQSALIGLWVCECRWARCARVCQHFALELLAVMAAQLGAVLVPRLPACLALLSSRRFPAVSVLCRRPARLHSRLPLHVGASAS